MFTLYCESIRGFPGCSGSKESACNAGDVGSISASEDSLEEEMATHSSILAGKIPWKEKPDGLTVHRVAKSQTRSLLGVQ